MKHYGMTAFAARRIMLRPSRWAMMGLALAVVTFLTATSVLLLFAIETTATKIIEAGPALVVSRVDAGGWAAIDKGHAQRIVSIPGVEAATPRVWGVLPGPPSVTVMADATLPDGSNLARAGDGTQPASEGELLVLRGLDGTPQELRLDARLGPNVGIVAHDMVLVPTDIARKLLLLPAHAATDIAVDTARDEENDALVLEIARALAEPVRIATRAQMLGAYRVQIGRTGTLAVVTLVPAILGLLLLVAVTASGPVSARTDVGKLKLMGWSSGEVAQLHVLETAWVGLVSVGLGLVSAYAGLFILGGMTVATTLFGWDQPPHMVLSTEGAALSLLVIGALVLLPCLIAALLPALRLATVDPIELAEGP